MESELVPFQPWGEFRPEFDRAWEQGEHVSLIGPTKTGKTTLGLDIIERRTFRVVIGTKKSDPALEHLVRLPRGRRYVERLELPAHAPAAPRVLAWPRYRGRASRHVQAIAIRRLLDQAFQRGRWCVFADEVAYLVRDLGLGDDLRQLWQMGATEKLSLVAATQRPAWVPLDLYSAPLHLFFWNTRDDVDLRRIAGLNGSDSKEVRTIVSRLDRGGHEVLYVNAKTGAMTRTVYQPSKGTKLP